MNTTRSPLRAWHAMNEREQSIWGAAYASYPNPGLEAALHAERVVSTLASLDFSEQEAPEHRAARLCRGLTMEEFRAWYVVELKVSHHKPRRSPNETDIEKAYEIYVMCGSDYY